MYKCSDVQCYRRLNATVASVLPFWPPKLNVGRLTCESYASGESELPSFALSSSMVKLQLVIRKTALDPSSGAIAAAKRSLRCEPSASAGARLMASYVPCVRHDLDDVQSTLSRTRSNEPSLARSPEKMSTVSNVISSTSRRFAIASASSIAAGL